MTRVAHKWAFEVYYSVDFQEQGNQSFGINVEPTELLDDMRRRRERDIGRER